MRHIWRISKKLGERKSLGVSVVATFPGETSAEGLEPRVESDGDDQELPHRVEDGTKIALAESVGYGKSQGENDRDLGPNQGGAVRCEKQNEGS